MASQMEVDGEPPPSIDCGGGLKRCSSAPMINMLVDCSPSTGPTSNSKQTMDDTGKPSSASLNLVNSFSFTHSSSSFRPVDTKLRTRHYSTSSLASNVSTPIKIPHRINELKRDDEVQAKVHREINHEREMTSAIQISQSWDDHFSLEDPVPSTTMDAHKNRPRSLSESLHIFTSGFPVASSPSPTRVGKQCFSPSMQAPVMFNGHNFNFTPSPSPSPTRSRNTRRSLSPIVTLKPSSLSQKRKFADSDADSGFSQPKRIFSGSLLSPASLQISQSTQLVQQVHHNNSLRLGLEAHALRQHTHSSLSTGSFDDSASEHSSVGAGGSMNNNTPSTSAHGPYGFSPLTLTDNCSTTTTDSEGDMYDSGGNTNNSNNTMSSSIDNSQTSQQRPPHQQATNTR